MGTYRAIVSLLALAALPLCGGEAAYAHAQLSRATPAVGGSVDTAPTEVALNFSEKLESTFSTVIVRDAMGKRVDKGDAHVDKTDRTLMKAPLESLMPGIYIVEWKALTADTHRTEGAFIFRVGP
jgi:methionine-rich copper-binding protein CopC